MLSLDKIKELAIPERPGSYQFFVQGEIVYVGKAINLKRRVYSYWQRYEDLSPAKKQMVDQIDQLKWIETDSEIEALLLESNLIKKHQPRYNIVWRDDKRYAYIAISSEDFPRIYITRKLEESGQFFGPFTSVQAARETIKIIRKIWPYRSCRLMPKRACLYYRLRQCPGVCQDFMGKSQYRAIIKNIILFLSGEKKAVVKQMETAKNNYEKKLKKIIGKADLPEINQIEQKISSYTWQLDQLNKVLANNQIVSLTEKYANDVFELAKALNLSKAPQRIEGYDLSNLYGLQAVGSMVVFLSGEATPSQYRRFKLNDAGAVANREAGDIVLLKEMLTRRVAHEDWDCPDLIVVDGAKAQVNAADKILKQAGLEVKVIGLGKDVGLRSARALDKIYFPGKAQPLQLSLNNPALHLLKRVRDEAHRFAITYHRQVRRRKFWQ
ncbi:MAG TPA: GIY-YIG nuclease family protein [bacterium]|nr:GIY-YIG nuclease family protein [bacterium]